MTSEYISDVGQLIIAIQVVIQGFQILWLLEKQNELIDRVNELIDDEDEQ